jgi:hypothetical protein
LLARRQKMTDNHFGQTPAMAYKAPLKIYAQHGMNHHCRSCRQLPPKPLGYLATGAAQTTPQPWWKGKDIDAESSVHPPALAAIQYSVHELGEDVTPKHRVRGQCHLITNTTIYYESQEQIKDLLDNFEKKGKKGKLVF